MKILAVSGSLRAASYNTALLHAARELAPEEMQIEVFGLGDLPFFNQDVEEQGDPAPVAAWKDAVRAADGLLIACPEYNGGLTAVLKNAIDWLSRPSADIQRVFGGLPVALIGASPGGFGTILSQAAWLPVFRTLGTQFWSPGRLLVARAGQVFGPDGTLTDEKIREQLRGFLAGFVDFTRSSPRSS